MGRKIYWRIAPCGNCGCGHDPGKTGDGSLSFTIIAHIKFETSNYVILSNAFEHTKNEQRQRTVPCLPFLTSLKKTSDDCTSDVLFPM